VNFAESLMLAADIGVLKSIAMVMLFIFFIAILIWLSVSSSERFKQAARIPLADDESSGIGHDDGKGALRS